VNCAYEYGHLQEFCGKFDWVVHGIFQYTFTYSVEGKSIEELKTNILLPPLPGSYRKLPIDESGRLLRTGPPYQ